MFFRVVMEKEMVKKDSFLVMCTKVVNFFRIPSEILPEFWNSAWRRNRISLFVICVMIFGMELFNMVRVLFWSSSGLGTWNNRIYFTLYLSLFLAAALCLIFGYPLRSKRLGVNLVIQYSAVLFFLLWHVCLNTYDLMRSPDAEVGLYITAVLGVAVFILMPAKLAFLMHASAYIVFMGMAGGILSDGDKINLTCTAVVALAVSLTNRHHLVTILLQQQEIGKINEQLRQMAQRDALTGLLNKSAFQRCVEAHPQTEGTTLLIADLDDFKGVNDRYGHPCGDYVLKEVSLRMIEVFPEAAGIGRIGGDEFGILTDVPEETRLNGAVQQWMQAVSQITWHGMPLGVRCSLGGCRICRPGMVYEDLYQEADRALYQAKDRGKNQFVVVRVP